MVFGASSFYSQWRERWCSGRESGFNLEWVETKAKVLKSSTQWPSLVGQWVIRGLSEGGVINNDFTCDCNLDFDFLTYCRPVYSFSRPPSKLSPRWLLHSTRTDDEPWSRPLLGLHRMWNGPRESSVLCRPCWNFARGWPCSGWPPSSATSSTVTARGSSQVPTGLWRERRLLQRIQTWALRSSRESRLGWTEQK